jgi:hypothetical protein
VGAPSLLFLFYVIPLLGAVIALAVLTGRNPFERYARARRAEAMS